MLAWNCSALLTVFGGGGGNGVVELLCLVQSIGSHVSFICACKLLLRKYSNKSRIFHLFLARFVSPTIEYLAILSYQQFI
jgi:hypothetical protein